MTRIAEPPAVMDQPLNLLTWRAPLASWLVRLAAFAYNCLRLIGQLGLTGELSPIRAQASFFLQTQLRKTHQSQKAEDILSRFSLKFLLQWTC